MLTTVFEGTNAPLIKAVSDFYVKDHDWVADVTWGKGAFWKTTCTDRFMLFKSDALTTPDALWDFRKLPYIDSCMDHVVLDPPYMHSPGKKSAYREQYKTTHTHGSHDKPRTLYHNEIMQQYADGMREAWRILRVGGMLWVKCKDEIESNWQRWSHLEVYLDAREIGFIGKDLLILVTRKNMPSRHAKQLHARKHHSYLWIFIKPTSQQTTAINKARIR
jgi:hypothetical protein